MNRAFYFRLALAGLALALATAAISACAARGQRYEHFTTSTPLAEEQTLIIGFLGGREPWDNERRNVRRLALKLRQMDLPGVHIETVENARRHLALRLVRAALDRNRNGTLDPTERRSARIILYGQSFGGAAVVKLANELHALDVPVMLTVQVDSVGIGDDEIPPNVRAAANLYQRDGIFISGEPEIRAKDPSRTRILGNWRYDYSDKKIDISQVHWFKRLWRTGHTQMDFDPEVWARVEQLLMETLAPESGPDTTEGGRH